MKIATIDAPFLLAHWHLAPEWWADRWPNFTPREIASRRNGELLVDPAALDMLQAARRGGAGGALIVTSAYRDPIHNALVGGAPRSMHKYGRAFDIRTSVAQRADHLARAKDAGFTGFGFYNTFLHVDTGRKRQWGSWQA